MAADLTAERYAQFRVIEEALLSASYAGVAGADDASREFELLRRELESPSKRHWADLLIQTASPIYPEVAS